ncbi:MAG: hypothetical protein KF774_06995 [Planctomyces sp.]|nr:hypothetical protein [Planctomyces sp.]
MPYPQFDELPFNSRPDLTPYLIHLTKNTKADDEFSAFDNLVSILQSGEIWGSSSRRGFIKGPNRAACFMDIPFAALKYILTPENADPQSPRYEAYGVIITKKYAHAHGCRPVLYLSDDETKALRIPTGELWRVVRFDVSRQGWICWLHEREWRCKGAFALPSSVQAVVVKNTNDARKLADRIAKEPKKFKCVPKSIIPLTVVSQGLLCP